MTPETIVIVALEETFPVSREELIGRIRTESVAWPRQIGMAALMDQFGLSSTKAARLTRTIFEMNPEEPDESEANAFRFAARAALAVIYPATAHAARSENIEVGLAQIRFALGIEERSMRDVAADLNVEVACISKGAKVFIRENNLPTPNCMKSDEASDKYREARKRHLTKNKP